MVPWFWIKRECQKGIIHILLQNRHPWSIFCIRSLPRIRTKMKVIMVIAVTDIQNGPRFTNQWHGPTRIRIFAKLTGLQMWSRQFSNNVASNQAVPLFLSLTGFVHLTFRPNILIKLFIFCVNCYLNTCRLSFNSIKKIFLSSNKRFENEIRPHSKEIHW